MSDSGQKFTPGPWCTGDEVNNRCVYCNDATGSIVAKCEGFAFAPRPRAEQEANARLIAASPTMYAFIQRRASEGDADAAAIIATI